MTYELEAPLMQGLFNISMWFCLWDDPTKNVVVG